jgi:hypothetical protein
MSEQLQVFLIIAPMVLALAFGLWAGLGYPGLYRKYESSKTLRRRSPADLLADWFVRVVDGRGKKETD